MTIKCLNCGYDMKTKQEVLTFLSELVAATVRNAKELLTLRRVIFGEPVLGLVAGPLNTLKAPCPKCGSAARWEDH